jgi:hypothetical protein
MSFLQKLVKKYNKCLFIQNFHKISWFHSTPVQHLFEQPDDICQLCQAKCFIKCPSCGVNSLKNCSVCSDGFIICPFCDGTGVSHQIF